MSPSPAMKKVWWSTISCEGRLNGRREVGLGEREADGVADALAERPGRDLDADGVAELGVPGRPALPLPELLDVVEA